MSGEDDVLDRRLADLRARTTNVTAGPGFTSRLVAHASQTPVLQRAGTVSAALGFSRLAVPLSLLAAGGAVAFAALAQHVLADAVSALAPLMELAF
jgi:hypothetical protein